MSNDAAATAHDPHALVAAYIQEHCAPSDRLLQELIETSRQEGLPEIQVPPSLGRLLGLLIQISGARRVLEIGTLAGYSAIWMARSLPPGGTLVSLEHEPRHAALASRFVERAGLAARVEVRVGNAVESLQALAAEPPFDFAFIDADTVSLPAYLDWALRVVRPGGLILADNVLRGALDAPDSDPRAAAMRAYNDRVAHDPRLEGVILLTRDGLEGLSLARVCDTPSA